MRKVLEECCAALNGEMLKFPWTERLAYADWLAQTYYYVSHSTRLLATAAGRFPLDDRGSALHFRFAAHITEEKKHEALALHDLKQLDVKLETLPERHLTRMFYETQYYKIERLGPNVLFGYILPLEAVGPLCGRQVMDRIVSTLGTKCVAFLKVHTEDDVDHLEKAFQVLEGISAHEERLVKENMRQTTFTYCAMLREIRTKPAHSGAPDDLC